MASCSNIFQILMLSKVHNRVHNMPEFADISSQTSYIIRYTNFFTKLLNYYQYRVCPTGHFLPWDFPEDMMTFIFHFHYSWHSTFPYFFTLITRILCGNMKLLVSYLFCYLLLLSFMINYFSQNVFSNSLSLFQSSSLQLSNTLI
jgi:hypothetical protein